MNELRVNTWTELQEALFTDSWEPELGRYRSRHAYRGLSTEQYELKTTLARLGGPYVDLERHLLRN
ncbi:MAG: FRG domain-containing protein, partial [Deltaproteobacteria bacterium]|nr:FRG domain-containing protein [Deltaproteobacteria bacterium]